MTYLLRAPLRCLAVDLYAEALKMCCMDDSVRKGWGDVDGHGGLGGQPHGKRMAVL